jgi:hypothetical protein
MFCFLIDPTGWTEINGEAFAPGFFLWNSEVGKRSVGNRNCGIPFADCRWRRTLLPIADCRLPIADCR